MTETIACGDDTTMPYKGVIYRVVSAGFLNDLPYAKIVPPNDEALGKLLALMGRSGRLPVDLTTKRVLLDS
jgi:hypothetical protein